MTPLDVQFIKVVLAVIALAVLFRTVTPNVSVIERLLREIKTLLEVIEKRGRKLR